MVTYNVPVSHDRLHFGDEIIQPTIVRSCILIGLSLHPVQVSQDNQCQPHRCQEVYLDEVRRRIIDASDRGVRKINSP